MKLTQKIKGAFGAARGYFDRLMQSVAVIAAAGADQAHATPITTDEVVVTGADGAKGVLLPATEAKMRVRVVNSAAAVLKVYPFTGAQINALGANAAFSLPANSAAVFNGTSGTQIYTPVNSEAVTGTIPNLDLADTAGNNKLSLVAGENLSADRTLTINVGDAAATLDLNATAVKRLNLVDFHKSAAGKDILGDAADATDLGLADAYGSVLTGTQTKGDVTAVASEKATIQFVLPDNYKPATDFVLRVRAKVTVARQVSASVDLVVKGLTTDGALGADVCATGAQSINANLAYADKDFTITGAALVPGQVVNAELTVASNDTGVAPSNGTPSVSNVEIRYTAKQ